MKSLLERYDDPDHWEHPSNFDSASEERDFAAFVADLETKLGRRFVVETGVNIQDASFHSQIALPGGLLRFSNFGRMLAVAPGGQVPEDILAVVCELAEKRGYTMIPTADLQSRYPRGRRFSITTWWGRYFEYL